ncbi:MAG: hypothetical protein COU33_05345 [Candidatus Magasanikbacteria bacterium CG10_big_fil_rev_8_21_14_0_10_43_6]|uniref:DUF2061 domain-containing protein n=1 Tax=Candidatus Magasanikbacteria bacterium CG10_big_fil_rev_8_21_14_0_10_43_6 TaxID=1974650 RepID=A0A2M6VZR6_9BACT|nr:MAG: hypothetical protein COU33_05345 [Candidatus Magasanikbacteria bacterium CG10_big_fil_rev_8_21_14_0_10_43_6]
MMLVFLFTKELTLSLQVGVLEVTSKMIFYYIHERVWDRMGWGKKRNNTRVSI